MHRRFFTKSAGPVAIHTRSLSVSLPLTLDGHSVGTWWSLLAALHRTISSLAIRQIVDRARTLQTSRRILSSSPRSLIFFSLPSLSHLFLCSSLSLYPRYSLLRSDNPHSFSLFIRFSLSSLYIDESRIKRGLAIARQDLFAKTQRVIFTQSAIAIVTVIDIGRRRKVSFSSMREKR